MIVACDAGSRDSFISSMVQEAATNGYAGYNIDWEFDGTVINSAYADKMVSFVNAFKQALGGLSLSIDVIDSNINGCWCSGNDGAMDLKKLSSSSVDRIILEDYSNFAGTVYTSCPSSSVLGTPATCPYSGNNRDFSGQMRMLYCSLSSSSKVIIGMQADTNNNNPIADASISAVKGYGSNKIAIWPEAHQNDLAYIDSSGLNSVYSD